MGVRSMVFAIIFIAACALSISVLAQNDSKNEPKTSAQLLSEQQQVQMERERIQKQRSSANAEYEVQKKDCYQKFSVTDCLNQVRDNRNAQLADLRRQDVALSDAERKRKGADQVRKIEEKTAMERLEAQAEKRGQAIQAEQRRQARASAAASAANQANESIPGADASSKPQVPPTVAQASTAPAGAKVQAKVPVKSREKSKESSEATEKSRQTKADNSARKRAEYDKKLQEAAEHQAEKAKKLQQAKKPPSKDLPVPP